MKRNIAIALLAVLTLVGAGNAVAQNVGVQATMPFEFTVGGKLLPAGTYNIEPASSLASQGVITIQNTDNHFWAMSTASRSQQDPVGNGELIFDKYGDKYFLHEVLCPNVAALNVDIPKSKLEKEVQIQEAKYGGNRRWF